MLSLKDVLLNDNLSDREVQEFVVGLDKVAAKVELFVEGHPESEVARKMLASVWDLQAKLFALSGEGEQRCGELWRTWCLPWLGWWWMMGCHFRAWG
jgi:hypothetical protein